MAVWRRETNMVAKIHCKHGNRVGLSLLAEGAGNERVCQQLRLKYPPNCNRASAISSFLLLLNYLFIIQSASVIQLLNFPSSFLLFLSFFSGNIFLFRSSFVPTSVLIIFLARFPIDSFLLFLYNHNFNIFISSSILSTNLCLNMYDSFNSLFYSFLLSSFHLFFRVFLITYFYPSFLPLFCYCSFFLLLTSFISFFYSVFLSPTVITVFSPTFFLSFAYYSPFIPYFLQ